MIYNNLLFFIFIAPQICYMLEALLPTRPPIQPNIASIRISSLVSFRPFRTVLYSETLNIKIQSQLNFLGAIIFPIRFASHALSLYEDPRTFFIERKRIY